MLTSQKIRTLILSIVGIGMTIFVWYVVTIAVSSIDQALYPIAMEMAPDMMGWHDQIVLVLNLSVTLIIVAILVSAYASRNGYESEDGYYR
ncbi:low affinity Fe/Cu permease [Methanococcus voltae]|uniref:Low affinity Fe/Cu permease n=1 Tax=Methanococcus voltae PS TaxID=523842 RepID=A0ABT2EVJ7_METVO|nr:hypothetical protein [Methanococcus voltae]MBP2143909.1 low affinity Fe/Cu permease [Methanococcus voltae]MCS3921981.1 low affinity Fe/Cu permease [Methanococcus voltae PS]